MGTISLSLPSDGTTIDASDVNTPLNTIATAINGNLDSNNILAGGVLPNQLTGGAGTSWAWQTWTPTWANLTVGDGTVTAKYIQIGKTVFWRLIFVLGSTSAVASQPSFTPPVTRATYGTSGSASVVVGSAWLEDTGVANYQGFVATSDSSPTFRLSVFNVTGTYSSVTGATSAIPHTWGTGDSMNTIGTYEAA